MALIPFVLALCIIPTWYQFGYILPVCRVEVLGFDPSLHRVSLDGPGEKLSLIFIPIPFRSILSIE